MVSGTFEAPEPVLFLSFSNWCQTQTFDWSRKFFEKQDNTHTSATRECTWAWINCPTFLSDVYGSCSIVRSSEVNWQAKKAECRWWKQTKEEAGRQVVLRHSCPIPQISILRNCSYQKLRILDLPQKSPLWYHEKKSRSSKTIFKIKHKFFFELETFSSCSGFIFMMMFEVTWLNVKKKLTPPLWELPQGGVRSKWRKRTRMSQNDSRILRVFLAWVNHQVGKNTLILALL